MVWIFSKYRWFGSLTPTIKGIVSSDELKASLEVIRNKFDVANDKFAAALSRSDTFVSAMLLLQYAKALDVDPSRDSIAASKNAAQFGLNIYRNGLNKQSEFERQKTLYFLSDSEGEISDMGDIEQVLSEFIRLNKILNTPFRVGPHTLASVISSIDDQLKGEVSNLKKYIKDKYVSSI